MDLEVFDALRAVGVPDDKARAAVESINRQIDRRYALHAEQLATRTDAAEVRAELRSEVAGVRAELERIRGELVAKIAEARTDMIQWSVGSVFASVGMFAAITRLLAH